MLKFCPPRLVMLFITLGFTMWGLSPVMGQSGTIQYTYDSLNQLSRVIDSEGNVLTYTYDEVGNILSIERTTLGDIPLPTLTSATPNQINQDDPATVVLSGTSLLGGTVSTTHPGITVDGFFGDDTQITVNLTVDISSPLGPAPLTVTTVKGSDTMNVTVVAQRPRITSITPNQGPSTGDTAVTVSGRHFTPDTTLTIGGNPATNIVVVDSSTITATTPPGPSGQPPVSVDVEVSNINGSDILTAGFEYIFGLNYGDIVSQTIDPIGNEDIYAFNSSLGDQLLIRVKPTSSAMEAAVRVLRADGSELCAGFNGSSSVSPGALLELTTGCVVDQPGVHTILVSETNGNETGDYDLSLFGP